MEALDFIADKDAVLLHCGMGTGKSRIALECAVNQLKAKRVLILCPLSVIPAWGDQIKKYAPTWRGVYLAKGGVEKKTREAKKACALAAAMDEPIAVVINYESARRDPFSSWALCQKFDLLVMDESHRLKSPKGAASKWVFRLSKSIRKRLALTGTPMPHDPLDIWAQMRSLDPSVFGTSFYQFRKRHCIFGGWEGRQVVEHTNLDDLRQRMSRLTFQASRDVLDLPDAIHEHRMVELSPEGQRIYDQMDREFCAQVGDGEIVASNALVQLLRLQMLTSGSVPVESGYDTKTIERVDHAKEDAIVDILEGLPMDEPVVIFGRFHGDLESGHAAAKRLGRSSLELSGRKKQLAEWQAGEAPILCAQIQAGGVGVDLVRASYCLLASLGFSLGDYEQALARCHRPGQERTVFYYHILAKGTVDEKVYRALRARKNVVESVLADIQNRNKDKP